jgi:hypothetical protein
LNLYAFNFVPELWKDHRNVPMRSASQVMVVNGFGFTGSIVGLSYVGGNDWWNYGTASDPYGVLPYNNGDFIAYRGDFVPLVPSALATVTFTETGLPSGTSWSVTFNGIPQTTDKTSMQLEEPGGTYAFDVGAVSGHTATPSTGAVVLNGANQRSTSTGARRAPSNPFPASRLPPVRVGGIRDPLSPVGAVATGSAAGRPGPAPLSRRRGGLRFSIRPRRGSTAKE